MRPAPTGSVFRANKRSIAVEILPMIEAEAKQRQKTLNNKPSLVGSSPTKSTEYDNRSRTKAAKITGTSDKSVQLVKKIQKEEPAMDK